MTEKRNQINVTGYRGKGGAKRRELPGVLPNVFDLKEAIEKTYRNQRDKTLFCFVYLTGGRISEVLSIKKKQISIDEKFGKRFITIFNVPILKRIRKTTKGIPNPNEKIRPVPVRTISIRIDKEGYFTETFMQYLNLLSDEDWIFKGRNDKALSRSAAWKIIASAGYWCHLLRHIRLTHLITEYKFTSFDLKEFTGWATLYMGERYVQLTGDTLAKKMAEA